MPSILITGASTGIGAATAVLAAGRGYDVGINYASSVSAAADVAKSVESAGQRALLLQADVSSEADVSDMFGKFNDAFGAPDALVLNAGTLNQRRLFEDITLEEFRRTLDVNLLGLFLCAREGVRMMSKAHGGRGGAIVNVSSRAAEIGSGGEFIDYAASKGGVDTLTKGLAKEQGPHGVRVNAVRPGLILTDIHAKAGAADRIEAFMPGVPMGRAGEAREVAEAILYLASDEASYITGVLMDVGGGR